jgi:transcriptional regulator with XRE-family HTH domain
MMQAFSVTISSQQYAALMQTGRPSKEPRTEFGQRLLAAREAAGLSQAQVAGQLGITQKAYAVWERYPVALRPKQIEKVASILRVSVEYLFGGDSSKSRGKGPAGKLRQVFERASQLPRHQQNKVAEFVEAFVDRQAKAA